MKKFLILLSLLAGNVYADSMIGTVALDQKTNQYLFRVPKDGDAVKTYKLALTHIDQGRLLRCCGGYKVLIIGQTGECGYENILLVGTVEIREAIYAGEDATTSGDGPN